MTLTKEAFATRFDGTEYPLRISREDKQAMKDLGLVVVYGASDDLMELDGAIYDEVPAPGTTYIKDGALVQEPDCECGAAEKLHELERLGRTTLLAVRTPNRGQRPKTHQSHHPPGMIRPNSRTCRPAFGTHQRQGSHILPRRRYGFRRSWRACPQSDPHRTRPAA